MCPFLEHGAIDPALHPEASSMVCLMEPSFDLPYEPHQYESNGSDHLFKSETRGLHTGE